MDTFKTSESIAKLSKALAVFHSEVETIKKDADNPFFHSAYSPLETILPAIDGPLQKAKLEVVQIPHGDNMLTTLIIDTESGEFIQGSMVMTPVDKKPQSQGSAITYARRYMIVAMLRLNTDKDDDGNSASFKKAKTVPADSNPHVDTFMEDLHMSEEDLIKYDEKLESAKDLKELKAIWASLPPMAQDELFNKKEELKSKLK